MHLNPVPDAEAHGKDDNNHPEQFHLSNGERSLLVFSPPSSWSSPSFAPCLLMLGGDAGSLYGSSSPSVHPRILSLQWFRRCLPDCVPRAAYVFLMPASLSVS